MVASAGLEPARRIAPQDFKSRLSTDSNKRPFRVLVSRESFELSTP